MGISHGSSAEKAKGKYFYRLFIVNIVYRNGEAWAKCRCACDKHLPKEERKIIYKRLQDIKQDKSKSCGCLRKEVISTLKTIHGEAAKRTIEYKVHSDMIQRCYNKKNIQFKNYGGRGITVYKPWHKFKVFLRYLLKYLGRRPSDKYSIDRKNNNRGYMPGNIRWATAKMQTNNRRKA